MAGPGAFSIKKIKAILVSFIDVTGKRDRGFEVETYVCLPKSICNY